MYFHISSELWIGTTIRDGYIIGARLWKLGGELVATWQSDEW